MASVDARMRRQLGLMAQLGQLEPLASEANLLAVLLSHLPLKDRKSLSSVCRWLCKQVRSDVAVKLAFQGLEGEAAAATPSSRAFTGAVAVSYRSRPRWEDHRAMAALLRHAADTWPYLTSITLHCDWTLVEMYDNPVALVGPLRSAALLPHLVHLSLRLPRLTALEMEALAALTGLTRLQLTGYTQGPPVVLPSVMSLLQLVRLQALALTAVSPGNEAEAVRLPHGLTALSILSYTCVRSWLPALKRCITLQQLQLQLEGGDEPEELNVWDLLWALAPHLVHLTSLTITDAGMATEDEEPPQHQERMRPDPCFPALRSMHCPSTLLRITHTSQWRLLAACPALQALTGPLAAAVPPPYDLGQLGLTRLGVGLSEGWAEAGILLRYCPRMEVVVVSGAALPETLPLVLAPLQHLQRVVLQANQAAPQLVEVLAPSLSTTRSLELAMPLGPEGQLPDLSPFSHLTQLVWTTRYPTAQAVAAAAAAAAEAGEVLGTVEAEDLLWSLRGAGGLEEVTLIGWHCFDARLALGLAGAHPNLRRLKLTACGLLLGNGMRGPEERLQRIRGVLRPSLVLEVVNV